MGVFVDVYFPCDEVMNGPLLPFVANTSNGSLQPILLKNFAIWRSRISGLHASFAKVRWDYGSDVTRWSVSTNDRI